MIYTTAEYIGMALLVVGFLAAGFAITRLDHALTREPEGDGDASSQTDPDEVEASAHLAETTARTANGAAAKSTAPRSPGTRRARRKHGR